MISDKPVCKCGSERILSVSAKCSDLCFATFGKLEHDGYVPNIPGLSDDGDYLSIDICADCGKVQGFMPLSDARIAKAFKEA